MGRLWHRKVGEGWAKTLLLARSNQEVANTEGRFAAPLICADGFLVSCPASRARSGQDLRDGGSPAEASCSLGLAPSPNRVSEC